MKSRIIQVPVTLDSANRKKDRSVKFAFTTTREITTDEFLIVDTYHQSAGWLLFKENEFKEEEVPDTDVNLDVKSPSLRLKNILYVYHIQNNGAPGTFRRFYESAIEKYIEDVKEQLDA